MGNICESCRGSEDEHSKQPSYALHVDEAKPVPTSEQQDLEFQRAEHQEASCFASPPRHSEDLPADSFHLRSGGPQQGIISEKAGFGPLTTVNEGDEENATNTETARGGAAQDDAFATAPPKQAEEFEVDRSRRSLSSDGKETDERCSLSSNGKESVEEQEDDDFKAAPRCLCCGGGKKSTRTGGAAAAAPRNRT